MGQGREAASCALGETGLAPRKLTAASHPRSYSQAISQLCLLCQSAPAVLLGGVAAKPGSGGSSEMPAVCAALASAPSRSASFSTVM